LPDHPDDLDAEVSRQIAHATRCGALQPLATDHEVVEDCGVPFVVHILTGLEHKEVTTANQLRGGVNPFLPPDPDLFVTELTPSHRLVLNKFNVMDRHLLIVTRAFEHQDELLDLADFEALALCMAQVDGLGFYNAGVVAGASQEHKHLQLVSLPLGPGPEATPMDRLFASSGPHQGAGQCPGLPFPHAVARRSCSRVRADEAPALLASYRKLLDAVGVADSTRPYNLLVTRSWMLLVPRAREHFAGVSVNSLGFAGSLLVPDREHLELMRETGPMKVLEAVAG
jgi:ATP adenylyltransferase